MTYPTVVIETNDHQKPSHKPNGKHLGNSSRLDHVSSIQPTNPAMSASRIQMMRRGQLLRHPSIIPLVSSSSDARRVMQNALGTSNKGMYWKPWSSSINFDSAGIGNTMSVFCISVMLDSERGITTSVRWYLVHGPQHLEKIYLRYFFAPVTLGGLIILRVLDDMNKNQTFKIEQKI